MNGIIVVNKEKNYTSRDVVNILSKILGTKKIGHTGTLDPIAEGVLVCVVGKCTKLCDILTSEEKEYIATMQFGVLTDTLDNTGTVLKTDSKKININDIKIALERFMGEYLQEVPIYSSVKINGKKLYEYARNGESVELPKRMVNIKSLEILDFENNVLTFKTLVSKGTYIRSLIRDIAEYLNTYGTMTKLIRTKQGDFDINNSYTLEDIKNGSFNMIGLSDIFNNYPQIELDENELRKVRNGQEFNNFSDEKFIVYKNKGDVVAIYQKSDKDNKKIKPLILV